MANGIVSRKQSVAVNRSLRGRRRSRSSPPATRPVINRFFNLDGRAYEGGALDEKTKELLGLIASMVLRCDDCITYHVIQCVKCGVTVAEFEEAFAVALVVGGSIVIPHLRRGVDFLDQLEGQGIHAVPEHRHD